MAEDHTASIIPLHQSSRPAAKTPAERAAAYRQRKKAANLPAVITAPAPSTTSSSTPVTLLPREDVASVDPTPRGAGFRPVSRDTGRAAPILLTAAALALAGVGVTMNALYAHSLGATETAGHVFLVLGLAADLVALLLPSVAAGRWQARQQVTAAAGWAVWALTFVFAITASIGFASVNIADVTASRASRVTPAIVTAQAALADAVTARDRECKGGVGRFCREREAAVTERRQALDTAMRSVEETSDPQARPPSASSPGRAWATCGRPRTTSPCSA